MKVELIVQVSSRSQSWVHMCQGRPPGTHPRSASLTFAVAKASGISHSLFRASEMRANLNSGQVHLEVCIGYFSVVDTPNRDSLSSGGGGLYRFRFPELLSLMAGKTQVGAAHSVTAEVGDVVCSHQCTPGSGRTHLNQGKI